ncbi:hypothetical protein PAPHI01_2282 [Pancytospora philotis]|nr:hypothetical protein PAPHI01_2282 [Pancytospora philotis]
MYVAIDIGSYKTVLHVLRNPGAVDGKKLENQEFSTVLSLTKPQRYYGKSVSSDMRREILLRRRGFFGNIRDSEAQKYVLMYLNYLAGMLGGDHSPVMLVVPEYFGEAERTILQGLVRVSQLRVGGFISHITSIAACGALRDAEYPEHFAVADFGHNKSAVGLFEYKEKKLTPKLRRFIKRGAADFDAALASLLIEKHALQNDAVMHERLLPTLDKIKKGLNTLESLSTSVIVDDDYNKQPLEITRDEFVAATKGVADEMHGFVAGLMAQPDFAGCGRVEVVGSNYNSFIIKDIMSGVKHSTILHPSHSAAIGGCLALMVSTKGSEYSVKEIVGSVITVQPLAQDEGKKMKETVVFKEDALLGDSETVRYSRAGPFVLRVLENGKPVGQISINKMETESVEKVRVTLSLNSYGLVEVASVTAQAEGDEAPRSINFSYASDYLLTEEALEAIRSADEEYAAPEAEYLKTSQLRHAVEANMDVFVQMLDRNFPGLVDYDEKDRIEDVIDGFFGTIGKSYEDEVKIKDRLYASLHFVGDKLAEQETLLRDEITAVLEEIRQVAPGSCKTPADYELYRAKFALGAFLEKLSLSLEKFTAFDRGAFDSLIAGAKVTIMQKRSEIERARIAEEEKKKAEAEGCAKEGCAKDCCPTECCAAEECTDDCGCGDAAECSDADAAKNSADCYSADAV